MKSISAMPESGGHFGQGARGQFGCAIRRLAGQACAASTSADVAPVAVTLAPLALAIHQGIAGVPAVPLVVRGNLHWPNETDSYTPEPDLEAGVWYARDVPMMAAHLKTEPILLVASAVEGDLQSIEPNPITITGIKNDHMGYAITWFLLAIVWAGMTLLFTWRITRQGISRRD